MADLSKMNSIEERLEAEAASFGSDEDPTARLLREAKREIVRLKQQPGTQG